MWNHQADARASRRSSDQAPYPKPNRAATVRECSMAPGVIDEDENAMWGRPPGLQADALVGLVGVTAEFAQRDQGVPRRPGGLPHNGGSDFQGSGPNSQPVRSLMVAARLICSNHTRNWTGRASFTAGFSRNCAST